MTNNKPLDVSVALSRVEKAAQVLRDTRATAESRAKEMVAREIQAAIDRRDEEVFRAIQMKEEGQPISSAAIKRAMGTKNHQTYQDIYKRYTPPAPWDYALIHRDGKTWAIVNKVFKAQVPDVWMTWDSEAEMIDFGPEATVGDLKELMDMEIVPMDQYEQFAKAIKKDTEKK